MSQDLRDYIDSHWTDRKNRSQKLYVTAFVGGDNYKSGVQLTMDGDYFKLSREQALDLATMLLRRIDMNDIQTQATSVGNDWGVMDSEGTVKPKYE